MEKNHIIQRINNVLTGLILNVTRFGKSDTLLIWVAAPSLPKVAAILKAEPELQLDWLENFTVAKLDGVFVMSYFVRSSYTPFQIVIRASEVLKKDQVNLSVPTVHSTWPMCKPIENEIHEMFGIRFI